MPCTITSMSFVRLNGGVSSLHLHVPRTMTSVSLLDWTPDETIFPHGCPDDNPLAGPY